MPGGVRDLAPRNIRSFSGQRTISSPLKLVVAFEQEGDKPDAIAELVEGLRFGYGRYDKWSSLPVPLFFERVVRDHVAEFTNEEEVEEGDDEQSGLRRGLRPQRRAQPGGVHKGLRRARHPQAPLAGLNPFTTTLNFAYTASEEREATTQSRFPNKRDGAMPMVLRYPAEGLVSVTTGDLLHRAVVGSYETLYSSTGRASASHAPLLYTGKE